MIADRLFYWEMCWDLIRRNSGERLHLSVCLPLIKVGSEAMSACTGTQTNPPHGTLTKNNFPGMLVEGFEEP